MSQFQCIATFFKNFNTGPHDPLPPLHYIGKEIFTAMPFPNLMTTNTTNTLIEFSKCNNSLNYRMHNWMNLLLKECANDAKHIIDDIVHEDSKISFIFNNIFEIFPNNTVDIFGKLYDVVGNIIKDDNIPVFIGSNSTCTKDFIQRLTSTVLSSNTESMPKEALGWRIIDEDNTDGLSMQGDSATTSSFASFGTQAVIMVCGLFFIICAMLKIREYCKSERKASYETDPNELPMTLIKSDKFVELNDHTYKYDENSDTWVNCAGLDSTMHV